MPPLYNSCTNTGEGNNVVSQPYLQVALELLLPSPSSSVLLPPPALLGVWCQNPHSSLVRKPATLQHQSLSDRRDSHEGDGHGDLFYHRTVAFHIATNRVEIIIQ